MPRFFIDFPLSAGPCDLPERAARHVQVLRLQPGNEITLFDGAGGEWLAVITDMRKRVAVELRTHNAVEREAARYITLAIGMPANEKMDWLVEKATELGVTAIQPLICERTVLRLSGERAEKKLAHWQAVAQSACEQCGRNRVPVVHAVRTFGAWAAGFTTSPLAGEKCLAPSPLAGEGWGEGAASTTHFILSTRSGKSVGLVFADLSASLKGAPHPNPPLAERGEGIQYVPPPAERGEGTGKIIFLSGPEGGLSAQEEQAAIAAGFAPICLGARVLRAETAPLVVLALLNTP
jgi:16S rRNA (uracil1498-N3)-methyltransferase